MLNKQFLIIIFSFIAIIAIILWLIWPTWVDIKDLKASVATKSITLEERNKLLEKVKNLEIK